MVKRTLTPAGRLSDGKSANDLETRDAGFGCWFADLPSNNLPAGVNVLFTFRWQERWEGKDFQVQITESLAARSTAAAEIEGPTRAS